MSLLSRLFGSKPDLDEEQSRRLAAWQSLAETGPHASLESSRFVVVDVETTGLSLAKDRLIAIGAVAVKGGQIDFGDSFEIVVQQQTASAKDNILIHGISSTAQTEGIAPAEALLDFLEYLGRDPLIAFHVTFDETLIKRALKDYLGLSLKHTWLDLAYAVPALYPELSRKYHALDDWIGYFRISNFARHSALADALATAQLFQVAASTARRRNITELKGLLELEKAQRWVSWAS
jgi:DNA polymerase-3 subunit epsilon